MPRKINKVRNCLMCNAVLPPCTDQSILFCADVCKAKYLKKKKSKKPEKIKVYEANGCFDIRALYRMAHERALEAGWKDYTFVNSTRGNELVICRTK